jgi:hypothetical protein
VNRVRVFFLALSFGVAAALAQDMPTGIVKSGSISLGRSEGKFFAGPVGTIDSTTDVFNAAFKATDYSKVTPTQTTTIGSCVVTSLGQSPSASDPSVTLLDAGAVMNVSGPNGSQQFAANKSSYSGMLGGGAPLPFPGAPAPTPLWLDPGTYTVDNGGGGVDVPAFKATLTIQNSIFTWTNADSILSIDRSAGVDVTWTGGDPASQAYITGSSSQVDSTTLQITGGAVFVCTADLNAGHFFVPPEVLTLLPASGMAANMSTGGFMSPSTLIVASTIQATFDVPGIDMSVLTFSSDNLRNVQFH